MKQFQLRQLRQTANNAAIEAAISKLEPQRSFNSSISFVGLKNETGGRNSKSSQEETQQASEAGPYALFWKKTMTDATFQHRLPSQSQCQCLRTQHDRDRH